MIQVCIMSGHEGRLGSEGKIYLTLMGACELRRPTFARQIVNRRQQANGAPVSRQTFVTLMGATEILAPTLAEEFLELSELLGTGAMTMADWDRAVLETGRSDANFATFTLMGAFDECALPEEPDEIDALALHQHLGHISESACEVLRYGIGQRDAERRATLRRALGTASTA